MDQIKASRVILDDYAGKILAATYSSPKTHSAAWADTLDGLADVTVVDDAIVSFRYAGTEYVVADGDLMLGTTTRWYIPAATGVETLWPEGDPAPPAASVRQKT